MTETTKLTTAATRIVFTKFPPTKEDERRATAKGKPKGNGNGNNWPERKLAEFVIEFVGFGFLGGYLLRGFSLMIKDGREWVSVPQRDYVKKGEKEKTYYDVVRAQTIDAKDTFTEFVVTEYRRALKRRAAEEAAAAAFGPDWEEETPPGA